MNRFAILLLLLFLGCDSSSDDSGTRSFAIIALPGIDRLSLGGSIQIVVRTQQEYEELIYERFQKPLNDYCNRNYSDLRQTLMARRLSEEEIQRQVNETCIAQTPILRDLEEVTHPEIDFSRYTLIGQSTLASGCTVPDYQVELIKEASRYLLRIQIVEQGSCEPVYYRNIWVRTSRIPFSSTVEFETSMFEDRGRKGVQKR